MLFKPTFLAIGAATSALASASTYTQEVCLTKFGSRSTNSIKTKIALPTIIVPVFRKSTSTPSTTTTATALTSIITDYVTTTSTTTLSQITDTFSTTSTDFTTVTSTVVVSSTETDTAPATTVTSTPAAVTLATSAGFTPIASAQPGVAKIRRRAEKEMLRQRAAAKSASGSTASTITLANNLKLVGATQAAYPTEVDCVGLVEVFTTYTSTITAKSTRTVTTTPPVVISSTTSTISTTLSVLPADASTTLSFSTTSTISTTTMSTSVTTTTTTPTINQVAPTPTVNGMCLPNNLVSSYNGAGINALEWIPGTGLMSQTSTSSAYDCCVLCANTAGCGGAGFVDGSCFLSNPSGGAGGSCDGSKGASFFGSDSGTSPADGFVVSNGPCGQYKYDSTIQ